jgi:GT2 family glycosyltransferase
MNENVADTVTPGSSHDACSYAHMNSSISVIILVFNGIDYLRDCIESVLDQDMSLDHYQLIVADNNSSDGSADWVEHNYPSVRLLRFSENHGFARGNNLAAEAASGELLVFLNQDTLVGRSWLSGLADAIRVQKYDACCSNMLLPRNEEFSGLDRINSPLEVHFYELTRYGYVVQETAPCSGKVVPTRFISGASFIISRGVLSKLGYLFEERMGMYCEDTELALRMGKAGFRLGVVPQSVVYHFSSFSFALHEKNVRKNFLMSRNRILAYWLTSSASEFLTMFPRLVLAQPHKVFTRSRQLRLSLPGSVMLTAAGLCMGLIGTIAFIAELPTLLFGRVLGSK